MRKLVIIGAGSHGSGIETIVSAINDNSPTWDLLGYLDDDLGKAGVIGSVSKEIDNAYYVIGVNEPYLKKKIFLKKRINSAATLVHPSVIIGDNVFLSGGVVLFPGVIITGNVLISSQSHINVGSTVSQGTTIGKFLSAAANIQLSLGSIS